MVFNGRYVPFAFADFLKKKTFMSPANYIMIVALRRYISLEAVWVYLHLGHYIS